MAFDAHAFLVAIFLVFILEGLFPFISPTKWRAFFIRIAHLTNDHIRLFGLLLIVIGVVALWILHA